MGQDPLSFYTSGNFEYNALLIALEIKTGKKITKNAKNVETNDTVLGLMLKGKK